MEEDKSPGKTSATTASTSDDGGDSVSEEEFRQGILKAVKHRAQRKKANIKLSPERRDELLQDSFPKIHPAAEGGAKVKELTRAEYAALRSSLQKVVRVEVQEKIRLLRAQLSEYHSVLEDCMAYKSRCEQLEQEKQDLEARSREVCQLHDQKIEMLERELAHLRNERRLGGSSRNSNSDWVSSIISGAGASASDGNGSEDHSSHPTLALPSTQLHRRMNNNSSSHQYYSNENESRRTISRSLSPTSLTAMLQNHRSDNLGAIRPLPFPGPGELASHMHPQPQVDGQRGAFLSPPCSGQGRSPKRHRSG